MADETRTSEGREASRTQERRPYEPPRIQVMSERDILNSFQITQSMASWWTTTCC